MTPTTVKKRYEVLEGTAYLPNPNFDPTGIAKPAHHPDRMLRLTKGMVVESEIDLERKFVNKFKKVTEAAPVVVTEARRQKVREMISAGGWTEEDRNFLEALPEDGFNRVLRMSTAPQQQGENRPASSVLGEEVTHQFQQAYDNQFRVWRNPAGKHQVTRGPDLKPLNPKSLDAEKVEDFIARYLKESK